MNKLVVLTDLGTLKAYQLEADPLNSTPRLEPFDTLKLEGGDTRLGNRVSDQAGRFTKNAPGFIANHAQSNGERHNMWLETERRSIRQIADKMSDLLSNGRFESCYFAAASEINKSILDHLPADARAKVEKNVCCNLVKAAKSEILQHFYH